MLALAGSWLVFGVHRLGAEEGLPAPGEAQPPVVRRTEPAVVQAVEPADLPEDPTSFTTVIYPDAYRGENASLEDVLSEVPGVQVRRFGGPGQASEVSIRGSTAAQVVILLDGVRLNSAQTGAVDLSTIPLALLDRIEVSRGGGSAQVGSDAIGGVIHLISKRAETRTETAVTGSAGSFDTYQVSAVDRRSLLGTQTVLGYDGFFSQGDFEFRRPRFEFGDTSIVPEPDPLRRVNAKTENHSGLLRVGRDLGERTNLSLVDYLFYGSQGEPGLDSGTGELGGQQSEAHARVTRNLAIAALEASDLPLALDGALRLSHRYERVHFRDPLPRLGAAIDADNENSALAGHAGLARSDRFGWLGSRASLDLDTRSDRLDSNELPNVDRITVGVFLQDELRLLEDRLLLVPALRFDHTQGFGSEWIPRFGASCKPWSWLRFKANVERSYRVPNFDELYFPDKGFIRGNPALAPEEAINYDVGFELAFERVGPLSKVGFEAAYFRNQIDESIVFVLINPFTVAPLNTGAATAQGAELAAAANLTRWLRLRANYTYLDATLDDTGTPLPGRASNEVTARAELGPPSGAARLVFESVYTSSIPTTFTGQTRISGRVVLNASLSTNLARVATLPRWLPLQDVVLSVGATNLTDVSVRDATFFPQPGRAWFVAAELRR